MWQVVREGPEPRTPTRERAAAWQVLRAAVAQAVRRAVNFKPRVFEERVKEQPVEVEALLPRAPQGGFGVKVVEVVVLLAVAVYFVTGLVGFLVA